MALWAQGGTSLLGSEATSIAPSPHIPQRETRRDPRLSVPNEERELCHKVPKEGAESGQSTSSFWDRRPGVPTKLGRLWDSPLCRSPAPPHSGP